MPLFQLLVLCMLASKPIDAAIAVGAAAELFKAGLRTPKAVLDADRQTMIDAFGRAHYVRYDELGHPAHRHGRARARRLLR